MKDLKDKVVLITGGSRGIGAALARGFSDIGAKVAITYLSKKKQAEECANEIKRKGGECSIHQADVSNPTDVKRTVLSVSAKYGRIDVLVNNAGIWKRGRLDR